VEGSLGLMMADALKDVRDAGFTFFSLVPWIWTHAE
jgi:hypothetical protein